MLWPWRSVGNPTERGGCEVLTREAIFGTNLMSAFIAYRPL